MAKSIGSDFEIGFGNFFHRKRNNLLKKSILLSSGRDCIYYILKSLNLKSRVLLPSYLCNSMLVPFDELGVKYDFYNVDENLNIDITDLKKKIEKNTECVFVIHYFGVEQPKIRDIKEICEKNNLWPVLFYLDRMQLISLFCPHHSYKIVVIGDHTHLLISHCHQNYCTDFVAIVCL